MNRCFYDLISVMSYLSLHSLFPTDCDRINNMAVMGILIFIDNGSHLSSF